MPFVYVTQEACHSISESDESMTLLACTTYLLDLYPDDMHPAYRLSLLLKKVIDGHLPSGHGRLGVGHLPSAEDHRVFGITGLVGLDDILAQ